MEIVSIILIVAFINTLIIYCATKDIQEYIGYKKSVKNKLDNLLSDKITISFNEDEYEKISLLSKKDKCSIEGYLREIIKNAGA